MKTEAQVLTLFSIGILAMICYTSACNEAVCASLVSKCMLLKSCECNMLDKTNCTCCKDCHKCLSKLYTECCSCVGMCPETNPKSNLDRTSTVEELHEPIPALFSVLTEEQDELLRWTTYTYPAHLDLLYFKPRGHDLDFDLGLAGSSQSGEDSHTILHGKHRINTRPNADTTNCTVAYMAQCMSLPKCRDSCQSMGAARYRWFHDYGCCECIGSTCLDYGKGEALCIQCPEKDEEEEEIEENFTEETEDNLRSEIRLGEGSLGGDRNSNGENHLTEENLGEGEGEGEPSFSRNIDGESVSVPLSGGVLPGGDGIGEGTLGGGVLSGGILDSRDRALGDDSNVDKKSSNHHHHHHKRKQSHHKDKQNG